MSGIIQTLFGGGKAEQSSQSTSTPSNYTDPALSGLAGPLADSLRQLLTSYSSQTTNAGSGGTGNTTPQAPVTGQESDLLAQLGQQVGPGTDRASYIRSVLAGDYLPGQDKSNPFLSAAITAAQRPVLDNLTQVLSRDLPGRFTANGQLIQPNTNGQGGSSAFDRAAALAFQSAANASTDIAAKIGSDAYTNERTQQTTVAGLDQAEVKNTIDALSASALPRLIEQNGLDQGLALFQQQTQNLLDILKTIGAVQAPTLANTTQSTSQGSSTKDNGIIPTLFPKGI